MSAKRRAFGPAVKRRPVKTSKTARQRVRGALKALLILGLVGVLVASAAFFVLYKAISIPEENDAFKAQTTFVYYSGGKAELGTYYDEQNRQSIPITEMPEAIQDAVVAAENRSFWTDRGIDPIGILRAAFNNAGGGQRQGASTITQQYVKILYLSSERSYTRKVKEAIVSLKIHGAMDKREILEGYLNTIYFGRGAYGVQAASQAFFDKDAKDLNLRESAVLAAVINNPSRFNPDGGKEARASLRDRYRYVLAGMAEVDEHYAGKVEKAAKRLPKFPEIASQSQFGGQRGHMLTLVKQELLRLGFDEQEIDGGGLRVTTTFSPEAMAAAKDGVLEQKPEGFGDQQLHVGAATVEVGTGALRGFYGGQDYLDSQINWASAGGQAGSTMKVAALVAAIKDGYALTDSFDGNSPYELPDGTEIENQGDSDYGSSISMLTATENSVNTAFIDMTLGMDDGPEKIVQAAGDLGIPSATAKAQSRGIPDSSPGLEPITGVALGNATVSPINMANAYATIASGGERSTVHVVEKVVDSSGEQRYAWKNDAKRTIEEDIASDVSYALEGVVKSGSGTAALSLGRPAAGKTGTATNGRGEVSSAWFAGYTPQLATTVMYVRGKGNEQLDGWLPSYFGGSYPAETWTAIMGTLMSGLEVESFPEPAYVDGDAPDDGHDTYIPPAPTYKPQPKPTRKPSKSATIQTEEPQPTTPTPEPTETVPPPPPVPVPTETVPPPAPPPPVPPTAPPTVPAPAPAPPPAGAPAPPAPRLGVVWQRSTP